MGKIKARNVTLAVGVSGASSGKEIGGLKNVQFSLKTVFDEIRTKYNTGAYRTVEYVDFSCQATVLIGHETQVNNGWTLANAKAAALAGTQVSIFFTCGSLVLKGEAVISNLSEDYPVDGQGSFTVSFRGVGAVSNS